VGGMKLVVLQCADHFALKRGWAHPDPHNVIDYETAVMEAATGEQWNDLAPDEMAEEQILGRPSPLPERRGVE